MHWKPCAEISPKDTVSAIEFRDDLLACTSWDGGVYVAGPKCQAFEAKVSRPLFALAWQTTQPRLWIGGGERRMSWLDLHQCVMLDKCSLGDPVLTLRMANDSDTLVAGSTTQSLFLSDVRMNCVHTLDWHGAQCIDILDGKLAVARRDESAVFDLRSTKEPLVTTKLIHGTSALALKWLNAKQYALSDRQSHIHIVGSESFTFNSNRVRGESPQPRPIYALERNSEGALAAGGGDHQVFIWDYKRRALKTKIAFPMACVAVACSKTGTMAVALSNDEWSASENYGASKAKIVIGERGHDRGESYLEAM